jgi:hypothetical protein
MKIAILKVILWPKDTNLPPRIIPFELGKVNVVTGESGTGKSTLTWIIDYCLGSEKCSIPVGLIRELTGWFGLHLKLQNTEMLLARRNPGDQQSTTDVYWTENIKVDVPAVVTRNARVEDVKNRFNQIAYLPSLDFSGEEGPSYGGRPSFRDMASFNFQPQHIVANPYTLFYKADTTEHREKLRVIFPLVIGAIDSDTLSRQRELKDTEREFDRLRRELNARLEAARAWESEIEAYFLQARSLGLLPDIVPKADWTLDKYVMELQRVPLLVKNLNLPDFQVGTGEIAVKDLAQVVEEEDLLAQQIGSARRRLSKVEQLSSSVGEYRSNLTGTEDRLLGVGWLAEKIKDTHTCPVCAAVHKDGNPMLSDLHHLAQEFGTLTASVQSAPIKLDLELANLRLELREKEVLLSKARHKRSVLEERTDASAAQSQRVRQIYLFVGRVEQALENVQASRNDGDLRRQVEILQVKIAALKRDVDPAAQRERIEAAITKISADIANYAKRLKLEHASENVRLNARELTLQFATLTGRTDFLWEVGSGQNWVGYHIAGLLALHEHFVSLKHNSVPRFLVIDQPSQVYFPEAWPTMDKAPETAELANRSADIDGVRRIFAVLSEFLNTVHEDFQIIVTEHAGSITWEGLANVNVVANWRQGQGDFLIPQTWIDTHHTLSQ